MTDVMINNVIDNLAAKLSVPTAEVFSAIQAIGARDVIIAIILLVVVLIAAMVTICLSGSDWGFAPLVLTVISVVAMIASGYHAILYLVSPKAYAVEYILRVLR